LPAADNKTGPDLPDLFQGHDPAEVEARLIDVFSDMPCDFGDDMAPPSYEELESTFESGGEAAVQEELAKWRSYAECWGRSDGVIVWPKPKPEEAPLTENPSKTARGRIRDVTNDHLGKAFQIVGAPPTKKPRKRQ